jgi:hypothetical protein
MSMVVRFSGRALNQAVRSLNDRDIRGNIRCDTLRLVSPGIRLVHLPKFAWRSQSGMAYWIRARDTVDAFASIHNGSSGTYLPVKEKKSWRQ